ncbi:multiheme c-type cytochrome [Arcticibacter sp.]|uniref:multiheme c-type cytochrome n=1 Tax=Arcticibacter sp. TaxID=1872630 RepID=UPI003890F4A5
MNFQHRQPVKENAIAGSQTCRKCHAQIYDQYLQNPHQETSHNITSAEVTPGRQPDTNTFVFNNRLKVVVEKRGKYTYQVAYLDARETVSRRFDIVIGSGKRGYTYGYWAGKKLKQLPLSFFTAVNKWANSPGFPTDRVYYDRPIGSRCLECHASFVDAQKVSASGTSVTEELDRKSLIYGVDCERCHGPAGKHVQFHIDSPEVRKSKYLVSYTSLSRAQKVDACAVCHSGNDVEQKRSTFAFKPGDKLSDYYDAGASSIVHREADVHGSHTQLMQQSKCYIKSSSMTCNSCHNTHENIKGNLAIYSQRCMSCHKETVHSKATLAKGILKDNCIDCHMPKQASKLISFQTAGSGDVTPYIMRTHHIDVYPNPTSD